MFFIIFKGFPVARNCQRTKKGPLSVQSNTNWKVDKSIQVTVVVRCAAVTKHR